ncbi:hypothetical protein N9B73_11625 [Verrucomicrobiales bacterium]|jgi:hypothetical protein|nr:hypothetical protein [Verrucomicrobiales bacterium]
MLLLFQLFLATGLLASFTQPSSWKALEFDGVPTNRIAYNEGSMTIEVAKSSSPLVSVFPAAVKVREATITGTIKGKLNFGPEAIWTKKHDDALLRFGLIEPGTKKLSIIQRLAAPSWIKTLETMFGGKIEGIGKIRCFLLMPDASSIGKSRINPMGDIFIETIQAAPEADGSFVLKISFPDEPLITSGLWLLADGDDTDSTFSVTITDISVSE